MKISTFNQNDNLPVVINHSDGKSCTLFGFHRPRQPPLNNCTASFTQNKVLHKHNQGKNNVCWHNTGKII